MCHNTGHRLTDRLCLPGHSVQITITLAFIHKRFVCFSVCSRRRQFFKKCSQIPQSSGALFGIRRFLWCAPLQTATGHTLLSFLGCCRRSLLYSIPLCARCPIENYALFTFWWCHCIWVGMVLSDFSVTCGGVKVRRWWWSSSSYYILRFQKFCLDLVSFILNTFRASHSSRCKLKVINMYGVREKVD